MYKAVVRRRDESPTPAQGKPSTPAQGKPSTRKHRCCGLACTMSDLHPVESIHRRAARKQSIVPGPILPDVPVMETVRRPQSKAIKPSASAPPETIGPMRPLVLPPPL